MAKYDIKDDDTGRIVTVEMDSAPTADDVEEILGTIPNSFSSPAVAVDNRTTTQKIMQNQDIPIDARQTASIFPRAMESSVEGRGALKTIGNAGLDLLSLPGRELAGVAAQITRKDKGLNSFFERRARTGKESDANTLEKIVTAPENMVMGPAGRLGLGLAGRAIPTLANAAKAAPLAIKIARGAAEGAGAGVGADVAQKAQRVIDGETGTIPEEMAATGLNVVGGAGIGGAMPAVGVAAGNVGRLAGKLAREAAKRNFDIKLRPGQWGTNRGFDAVNVLKYDLDGTVRQIAEKSQEKLTELNSAARNIGKESTETVSLPSLIEKARAKFSREKNVHNYDKMQLFISELQDSYQKAFTSPDISLSDAMSLRSQIGDEAAFVGNRGGKGMSVDPDANWKEEVFNNMYDNIKKEIHAKAGPELQAINRAQSEIIPVRQVALRRLPISESNYRAGLLDATTTGIGAGIGALTPGNEGDRAKNAIIGGLGLAALRRGLGSKLVTRGLFDFSNKMSPVVERPFAKLNSADYPAGKPWPVKTADATAAKNKKEREMAGKK